MRAHDVITRNDTAQFKLYMYMRMHMHVALAIAIALARASYRSLDKFMINQGKSRSFHLVAGLRKEPPATFMMNQFWAVMQVIDEDRYAYISVSRACAYACTCPQHYNVHVHAPGMQARALLASSYPQLERTRFDPSQTTHGVVLLGKCSWNTRARAHRVRTLPSRIACICMQHMLAHVRVFCIGRPSFSL